MTWSHTSLIIQLTISQYSIDITLTNECETGSLDVMSLGRNLKSRRAKGHCIYFYCTSQVLLSCTTSPLKVSHFIAIFTKKIEDLIHVDEVEPIWRVILSIFLLSNQVVLIYSLSPYTHMSICLVFSGRNVPWGSHIKLADHSHVGFLSCPHLQSGRRHCINNSATI